MKQVPFLFVIGFILMVILVSASLFIGMVAEFQAPMTIELSSYTVKTSAPTHSITATVTNNEVYPIEYQLRVVDKISNDLENYGDGLHVQFETVTLQGGETFEHVIEAIPQQYDHYYLLRLYDVNNKAIMDQTSLLVIGNDE